MEPKCYYCKQILEKSDESDIYHCTNVRCSANFAGKCPMCNTLTIEMSSDDALLYKCDKCEYIWSYHRGCSEMCNPTDNHSEYIGYLLCDDDVGCSLISYVTYIETHDKFIYCDPYYVIYDNDSTFLWKCLRCNQKYTNMLVY